MTDAGNATRAGHRARHHLRLQQPGRRHAGVPDDARARVPGRLRRHAQPAAARRRRRRDGRAGAVHRAARLAPASRPASTASSSRCTRSRRARRATRRTRSASTCSSRCCGSLIAHRRHRQRRTRAMVTTERHDRPRPRPQGARDRGGRHPRARRPARRDASTARSQFLRECRGRVHPDRHGQVGNHLPQDRGDAVEHRHARRSSCTRPRPSTATSASSRPTTSSIALSYSGETDELLRLLETIRRLGARLDRHHRRSRRRRSAQAADVTLDCRVDRGGVPAEPGADREHDGGARARRRARDDAAGRARASGRRISPTCTRAASSASG